MKKFQLPGCISVWFRRTFTKTTEQTNGCPKTTLKKGWKIGLIVLACLVGFAAAGGTAAALYLRHLQNDAASLFAPSPTPPATPSPAVTDTVETTPTPTPDPYAQLQADADLSMMDNIVNVMLIGVDYSEEREDWDGKSDFHADVMIVVAINFDENTVDLISLPRDTYAKIPGVEGKYKLNASIDCGGGWPTEGGFEKVCEAAEWMLGGIPVDYYYAVSMPVVKELVDIIGGVEYEIEMDFSMQGREYKAGKQFLDGQAVLDYCRVRKDIAESGDAHRVNRQKEIMLALFEAAQNRSIITKIPQIIDSFEGDLYTNCSYSQTAALALFAYNLSSRNVSMYSMGGEMYDIFNWGYCLTDQWNRISIIHDVYGVWVEEYEKYSADYALKEWGEMKRDHYLEETEKLYEQIEDAFEADALLLAAANQPGTASEIGEDPAITDTPEPDPTAEVTAEVTAEPTPVPTPRFADWQHEKFNDLKEAHDLMNGEGSWNPVGEDMLFYCEEYRRLFPEAASWLGINTDDISWYVYLWTEIPVDFN